MINFTTLLRRGRLIFLAGISAVAASACQTAALSQTAVLVSGDDETMDAVKTVLADALGFAQVTLGAGDPTRDPFVAVLPPRPSAFENRSPVKPIIFDITISDDGCALVRRNTGEVFDLSRRYCRRV